SEPVGFAGPNFGGQRFVQDQFRCKDLTPGAHDPRQLREDLPSSRVQIEYPVDQGDVYRAGRGGYGLGVRAAELDVGDSHGRRRTSGSGDHVLAEVDPQDPAGPCRDQERIQPGATTEVQDQGALRNLGEAGQTGNTREGLDRGVGDG